MDPDDRVHDLLLIDALDDVLVAHVHLDGVARGLDAVRLQLDRLEQRRQAVELGSVLGKADRNGDVVCEGRILIPQAEVLEGRVALEKLVVMLEVCSCGGRKRPKGGGTDIKDRANEDFLLFGEVHPRGSFNVGPLDADGGERRRIGIC